MDYSDDNDDDVPSFFICPISLQIMKDPVTISTGMSYDRDSIHKWLFTYKHKSCPVTKQHLTDQSLTPNSTLLRLIESWSIENQSRLSKKILGSSSQPKKPVSDFSFLHKLVDEVSTDDHESNSLVNSLRKIKILVQENDEDRVYMESSTCVVSLVVSIISKSNVDEVEEVISSQILNEKSIILEEAMNVLYLLKPSTETLKKLSEDNNGLLISSLSLIIQHGRYQARIQAALLLKSIFKIVDNDYKADLRSNLFDGITEILKDQNSNQGTKLVLSILIQVLQCGKNGIKAVEAGVVCVLVELLAESTDKRNCEYMLYVLEILCRTPEGRSAFLAHPASLAAVASKILMVSQIANDKAVKVLLLICRFCKSNGVVQELIEVGGVTKLFMVVQVECSLKTKEKATEILGVHLKAWNNSPCFSSCFKL